MAVHNHPKSSTHPQRTFDDRKSMFHPIPDLWFWTGSSKDPINHRLMKIFIKTVYLWILKWLLLFRKFSLMFIWTNEPLEERIPWKICMSKSTFQLYFAFLGKLLNNSKYSDDISMFLLSPLLHWLRTSKPPSEDERKVSIKLLFIFPFNFFKMISQRMKPCKYNIQTDFVKGSDLKNCTRFKLKRQYSIIHSAYP